MPELENPKHEKFAGLLARGVKQGEAYKRSGFAANAGAASRLAQAVRIQDRIADLQREIHTKIVETMEQPDENGFKTLAEMGLTIPWVAAKYRHVYEESVEAGSYAAAVSALGNIQKLIEIENNGRSGDDVEKPVGMIDINAAVALLGSVRDIIRESKEPDRSSNDQVLLDISPTDG
jgi:hypothetical protein